MPHSVEAELGSDETLALMTKWSSHQRLTGLPATRDHV
jgi:hypothetical protein